VKIAGAGYCSFIERTLANAPSLAIISGSNILKSPLSQRSQLRGVGLGRCDAAFLTSVQLDHMVGGGSQRRLGLVGHGHRRRALLPGFLQDADDIRRLARLRDADGERALETRRALVNAIERRRCQRDGEPILRAKDVLRVSRGIVRRAPRGNHYVSDVLPRQVGADGGYALGFRVQQPPDDVGLFQDFGME